MGPGGGDTMSRAEVIRLLPSVTAIVSQGELRVDEELLAQAPLLQIVASASAGVDKLDLQLLKRRGIFATNAANHFAEATADCTLAMLLALLRHLPAANTFVKSGRWKSFQPGRWDGTLLRGKILGIVGYGAIGRAVATRARAFGLKVIHHQRTPDGGQGYRSLERLLSESDIVSLHVPLNEDSRQLINPKRMRFLKPGVWLINMSRGQVVDEAALLKGLKSGLIAGAALDVFANEPHVPSELRRHPNVLLTPHLGGGTIEGRAGAWTTCIANVVRVLAGRRPANLLNNFA